MPKMTSTPTASSDRTRLCAPVMPVAGSTVGPPVDRSVVSRPATEAAASRVAASRAAASLGVVVIAAVSWPCWASADAGSWRRVGQQKTPRATGTEGSARRSGTGALGDYEDAAEAAVDEQAGVGHLHTVRLVDRVVNLASHWVDSGVHIWRVVTEDGGIEGGQGTA